jgi:hypothetical protein
MTCSNCGGEMIQKNRGQLLLAGSIFVLSPLLAFGVPYFWAPGALFFLIGVYLIVWAVVGKGWCRACKRFGPFR